MVFTSFVACKQRNFSEQLALEEPVVDTPSFF